MSTPPQAAVDDTARRHVEQFSWWHGDPDLSKAEAELRDLVAVRDAAEEAIALHIRQVVKYEGVSMCAVAAALAASPGLLRGRYLL